MKSTFDTVARFILPLLSIAGWYCTWDLGERNGYWSHVSKVRETEPQVLPGTKVPVKLHYTGIRYVDDFLALLATIFWPVVDGSYPHASLQAFEFATQVAALWVVLEIEARRVGNKGRLISLCV